MGGGDTPLNLIWLEITGRCQLECVHCYAASGPKASPGTMTERDWCRVIDQAATLGVGTVQLIGGEPTPHPGLPALVERALAGGMAVEVYSNLVGIAPRLWEVLERPGVRLATSYYSPRPPEHEAITGRRGSHQRTLRNLREALRRGIPVRAGVVEVLPGQDVAGAVAELRGLGVAEVRPGATGRARGRDHRLRPRPALWALWRGQAGHLPRGRGVALRVQPLAAAGQRARVLAG